jgi:hypothetical protein
MFSFLYHIANLQLLSVRTWLNYKRYGKVDVDLVKRCREQIINSGFVVIKLCQWSLPRLNMMYSLNGVEWYKELEKVYDECNVHSDGYTKEVYNLTMGIDFDSKYELKEVVASGSIGQVHKIRDKLTGEIKAIKCKHPGTNMQYKVSIFTIRIFSYFLTKVKRIHYRIFPIELEAFYDSLTTQVYLSNESENIIKMGQKFKDEKYIIIPELYENSDDIIVMDYIEAVKYQDLDISTIERYKVCMLLYLSIKKMIIIDKFIHGDLHKGNWKVIVDNSDLKCKYRLVLYDMGFCFTIENIDKLYESLEENNIDKIIESLPVVATDVFSRPDEFCKKLISEKLLSTLTRPICNENLIINVITVCKNNGFILKGHFITMAILMEQTKCIFDEYLLNNDTDVNNKKTEDSKEIFENVLLKKDFPEIISFCNTYGIFKEMVKYYEKKIEDSDLKRSGIFESCDFSDILDSSLAIMD